MRSTRVVVAALLGLLALGASVASADTMNPALSAKLAGMGEHGIVNFQSKITKGQLCWTFDVPTKGVTSASIRDTHGMIVARLGKSYKAKSCAMVAKKALTRIEAKPGAYRVWLDTKGHPGDLRGKLRVGMAHMSKM
jgi:hypothetical protein